MAYNLARNSRVFVTTNLNTATGAVLTTGFTTGNTWEIQVLDGFSFSQGTNTANIQINEAGVAPIRGQRAFNTALNPVEISFSTYIRPRLASNQSTAEERVLWNALMGDVGIEGTIQNGATVSGTTLGGTPATTITRAAATASLCTVSGSALTTLTVGGIYNISGLTGTNAPVANTPIKVASSTSSVLTFDYLTAPDASLTTTLTNVTVSAAVKFTRSAWQEYPTATGVTTSYGQVTSAVSNKNQLQALGFIFIVDGTTYTIDNCALDQAQIDFGLDAIAMIAWNAKGTKLNQLATAVALDASANPVLSGGLAGTATGKVTTANYITNKLSTVTLQSNLGGISGTAYSVVLTGGSISIANNINYVTPNNIGTLNLPIGYYTGTRSVSGTMNAYLRTGTGNPTATLLQDILTASTTATDTKYRLQIEVGGSTNGTRVELNMPGAMIGIPSVDIADVVSTAITFNAQSTATAIAGNTYDIENTNDVTVRYFSL
jgi:hypothetical protein